MVTAAQSNSTSRKQQEDAVVAGIHLAGPNARKSAVVLLEISGQSTTFLSLYEKIGSSGSLFSDERILSILSTQPGLLDVMVDCPVTEPPCVSCSRPVCPGVVQCDDVAVAMMMAVEQGRGRKGGHKLRPFNPQNQRLWDVLYARGGPWGSLEPSYSANLAPLAVRAKTLQRRLRATFPEILLRETNVPILLTQLSMLVEQSDWGGLYRNFERGAATRKKILGTIAALAASELRIAISGDNLERAGSTVENFHAFMAAAVASWRLRGMTMTPAPFFDTSSGWVEILKSEHSPTATKRGRN